MKDFFEQHVNPDCIREEDCGLWIVYQDGKPCGAVFDGHAKASGEVCTEYQALYGWTGATKGNLIGYAPTVQEAADLAVRTILTMRESRRTVYAGKLQAAQSKLEAEVRKGTTMIKFTPEEIERCERSITTCTKSLSPRELTWDEFRDRLINAGWKPHEADQEVESMKNESESGM